MNFNAVIQYLGGTSLGESNVAYAQSSFEKLTGPEQAQLLARCNEVQQMDREGILRVCYKYGDAVRNARTDSAVTINSLLYGTCLQRWRQLGLDTSYQGLHKGRNSCVVM